MFSPITFYGERVADAQGDTIVYSDSEASNSGADERIAIFADGADLGILRPGGKFRLDRPASSWRIVPVGSSPILGGTVHIGIGDMQPATVNGSVSVVDGELQRSRQGRQGLVSIRRTSAAAVFPALAVCAYLNGFSAAVRRLAIDAYSTQNVRVWTAEVLGEPTYNERRAIRNKLTDIADVSFELAGGASYALTDSTVAHGTAPDCDATKFSNWVDWGPTRVKSGESFELVRAAPILLPAGYALVIVGDLAAQTICMTAEIEAIQS